ncbi:hypothetical protein ACU4GD_16600 [Cupriavidus basilensis]
MRAHRCATVDVCAHHLPSRAGGWPGRDRGVVQGYRPAPLPGSAGRSGAGGLPGALCTAEVARAYPPMADGSVLLPFPRFFIVATR